MLYDYSSEKIVQDIVLEDIEILIDDLIEEFYSLHRYDELNIYTPSPIAREIISAFLDDVDEVWIPADSENELLYDDNNNILITIAHDGMLFVEIAEGDNGQLKSNEDCTLSYVYDGFNKKDVDTLAENAESTLIFGFVEDTVEKPCERDKKSVSTSTTASYSVNGESVTKEEFDKKYSEFEDKYMDNIRDMLLRYCDLMDKFNDYQKLFRW